MKVRHIASYYKFGVGFLVVLINGSLLVTSSPSDIELDGSTVTLSCRGNLSSAIDDPSLLSIMWYHEEMTVQLTSNVSLSNDGAAFTNTLTIEPFNISSVGDYRCIIMIDNSTGETNKTIIARRKTSIKGVHEEGSANYRIALYTIFCIYPFY